MRHTIKRAVLYVVLIVLAVIWLSPMISIVATSLKSKQDFFSNLSLFQLPETLHWENFKNAFTKGNLFHYMRNDLIICLIKVPLGIFVEALAAYALTRLKIRRPLAIFIVFLLGMMLPMQVALIPLNVVYNRLGLVNTYAGLIFAYLGFGIPTGILILRGFMRGIPKELGEAAIVDGASIWRRIWHIDIPGILPTIAILLIMRFGQMMSLGFDKAYIMQNSLNYSVSEVLSTYIYKQGIKSTKYSYSAAISLFNNLINLIMLVTVNRISDKLSGNSLF
mgnify:CR=1 FL=1